MKIALIVIAIIAVLVIAFPWWGDLLNQSRDKIDTAAKSKLETEYLATKARQENEADRTKIRGSFIGIIKAERGLREIQDARETAGRELALQQSAIARAHTWLAARPEPDAVFELNGKTYPREQLVADVFQRQKECRQLRAQIDQYTKGITSLKPTIDASNATAKDAASQNNQDRVQIEVDANVAKAWELAEYMKSLRNQTYTHSGRYRQALAERAMQPEADQRMEGEVNEPLVPLLEGEGGASQEEEINRYMREYMDTPAPAQPPASAAPALAQ